MESPGGNRDRILEEMEAGPQPAVPAPSIAKVEAKMERLTWLFQEGDIDVGEYKRRRAQLRHEAERAQPPPKLEVMRAVDVLTTIGRVWRVTEDDLKQNNLLSQLLEAIYFEGPPHSPFIESVRPQPAVMPYWDLLGRTCGAEGIRTRVAAHPVE